MSALFGQWTLRLQRLVPQVVSHLSPISPRSSPCKQSWSSGTKPRLGLTSSPMGSVGDLANNRAFGFLRLAEDITQGLWLLSHELRRIMGKTYRNQGHLGHISSGVLRAKSLCGASHLSRCFPKVTSNTTPFALKQMSLFPSLLPLMDGTLRAQCLLCLGCGR